MIGESIDRGKFVGRRDEIEKFHALVRHQTEKPIWFIWGVGGIGKSRLLEYFEKEGLTCGFTPIRINLEEENITYQDILNEACDRLGKEHFTNFAELVEKHWEESRTIRIDSPQSPESSRIDFGQSNIFQDIYIQNMAGGNITNIEQIITNVEQERKRFFRKRETEAFVTELQQVATHQPIVWLFDTYEKIDPELESWLWKNLLENLYYNKMPNVKVVLTGRERVDAKKWQYVTSHELGYFLEHDVRTYLQLSGFAQIEAEFNNALFNFTKGHPLCVSIAIDLIKNMVSSGEEFSPEMFSGYEQREFEEQLVAGFLIKGILERVPDVSRNIIERCAVTRWFNRETLRLICGEDERIRESIDTLRQYSFVRSHQYGLTYHEIIQHLLYHDLRREDKIEFRKFNEKALHYFTEKCKAAESDKERQDYFVEQVYHQVAINENDGVTLFQKSFHVGHVLYDVTWCAALLKAVKAHPLGDGNSSIVLFYDLLLASMTNQWENILTIGNEFLSYPIHDSIHHARALELIATAYRHKLGKNNLEEAIKFYNQSLDIRQREADIDKAAIRDTLRERAECYRLQGDVIQTERGLKESLEIALQLHARSPKDQHALGMCYLYLGNLARVQGKWQVAFENYSNAVKYLRELDPYEYNRILYGFGYVSFYQGRWNEAIRYHKEAHQAFLKSKENYAIAATGHALGHDYAFLGEYTKALDVLQKSLDVFTENQWKGNVGRVLGDLGHLYYRQRQIEQAAAYFNQALDNIGRDSEHPHLIPILRYFGDLLCDQQQWEEAEHFYQQALFIAKKTESPFDDVQMSIRLCRLLYLSGRSEEISEYTEQIRPLAQQYEYFGQLARLRCIEGHVLLEQGNIDEAIQAYAESCAYAIRYNHYLLDEIFSHIIDGINTKNPTYIKPFCDYLSCCWNEHKIENIESEIRFRETGDGTLMFIKRISELQGRLEADK